MKNLATQWKGLSTEERKRLSNLAAESPESKISRARKPKISVEEIAKEDRKIKHTRGGFPQFIKEKMASTYAEAKTKDPTIKPTVIMQQLGKLWTGLSEKEKGAYKAPPPPPKGE